MKSLALFLVLFNPFLMSIYLLDLIQDLDYRTFFRVLVRATLISASVFMLFAWGGEAIFTNLLQVRFAAFLVFGGIVISLIALQMMFTGSNAIRNMRGGDPEHISGSIAMSLALTVMMLMILKRAFDTIKVRNAALLERYIDITGRAAALLTGSIGVQMIMQGLQHGF